MFATWYSLEWDESPVTADLPGNTCTDCGEDTSTCECSAVPLHDGHPVEFA